MSAAGPKLSATPTTTAWHPDSPATFPPEKRCYWLSTAMTYSDWSILYHSSYGHIRRLKPSPCGSNVSPLTFGSSTDWVMRLMPLPKRPSPIRRTDRSSRPLGSCSKQGRLTGPSSRASTQPTSYSSWVVYGAPRILPPGVRRSGGYSTSSQMAFSPERPKHVLIGSRIGAVMIGSCHRVEDLRTGIAHFIHDSNERCHPFTCTKTAGQILEHGQLPRISFTVHSPRGKNSASSVWMLTRFVVCVCNLGSDVPRNRLAPVSLPSGGVTSTGP